MANDKEAPEVILFVRHGEKPGECIDVPPDAPGPAARQRTACGFLGPEVVRAQRGQTSFTIRHPWFVAFAFGLLHGFGFTSGLTALGLPPAEIPLAWLVFNLGFELGQLAFVVLVVLPERAFRALEIRWPRLVAALPAYGIGSLGVYWTIQRTALLFGGLR